MPAQFTMRLKDLVKITNDHIGLDDYPIFNEEYRKTLNDRIKQEYWLQEIAHETPDIFIWRLKLKMARIMPRYNRMYEAELLNNDPLDGGLRVNETSQDGRSQNSGTNTQTSSGTGSTDSKGRTVGSDTPQTRLAGDGDYATSISDATTRGMSENNSKSATSSTGTSDYRNNQRSRSTGYNMGKGEQIARYRNTLVNVDDFVIAELSDLFMGIWDVGAPRTNHRYNTYSIY